jgi:hypothetical protein
MARNTTGLKRGGSPGRKKGEPNKATAMMRDAAQKFCADPRGRAKMLEQYQRGKLHPILVQMMHHYAYGKPKDTIAVEGGMVPLILDLVTDRAQLEQDADPDADA